MFKDIYTKFAQLCVSLYKKNSDSSMEMIGTAFFIAAKGYLLTAGDLTGNEKLYISFRRFEKGFFQNTEDIVSYLPVKLQQYSNASGLALLKTDNQIEQMVPLKIFDLQEELPCGMTLAFLGYNEHRILTLKQATLSAKLKTGAKKLYIFDMVTDEMANGSPIINPQTGLISAIINKKITKRLLGHNSDLTYAIAIEHAIDLLTDEKFYVR